MKYHFKTPDGTVHAVEYEPGSIELRRGYLRMDDRVVPYAVESHGRVVDVWVDGQTYRLEKVAAQSAGTTGGGRVEGPLKAPMPGTVLKVLVQGGDVVPAGATLVVMESMKMEMNVRSPGPARVNQVLCAPGQLVESGAVLMELEPASSGD